ncbi:ferrous iron transport protein B [bacterium]|nr:ferrous iron transport protein B [bacterium]
MKIALVGNQNSGKTSLFNVLTGSNQKIGNWPGVTIECISKKIKNSDLIITDLPGIYSLTSYTNDEEVSIDFILKKKVDLIINVVDVNYLERGLYLTTQLIDLNTDLILVLNMFDLVEHNKINIDLEKLKDELGITIIPVSTKNNIGIDELKKCIFQKKYLKNKNQKIFPNDIEKDIDYFCQKTKSNRINAINIIEKRIACSDEEIKQKIAVLEEKYKTDSEQLMIYLRYDYIEKIKQHVKYSKNSVADKLDKFFLHKFFSIPIFLLIMVFIYFVSISFVGTLMEKIPFDNFINKINFSSIWFNSFAKNIVKSFFSIASFIVQLFVFFVCLSIIETTGYMSRVSFLFDRIFNFLGLSGKSVIPFITAAGCSVPAIMNTCTIKNDNERKTAIALIPFIPCSAKMTIISFTISDFFLYKTKRLNFLFSFLFYLETIFIIIGILLVKKIFFQEKKQNLTYISELPDYKHPNFKYVFHSSFDKVFSFIKRDGILIMSFSIIIWLLTSFNWKFEFITKNSIDSSILASIGNFFSPFFYLMLGGKFCWAAGIVAIQGLFAKEQVVTSMKILGPELFNFSPIAIFAFFTFNLFSIPCLNTLNAIWFELKSFKKTLLIILIELFVAWFISSFIGFWSLFL